MTQTNPTRASFALVCIAVLLVAAVAACSLAAAAPSGGVIRIALPESDVAVYLAADGTAAFSGTGIQHIGKTGEPSLPCQSVRVLLPPDADTTTVGARITGQKWTEIGGQWDIRPVGPLVTGEGGDASPTEEDIVDGRDVSVYESDTVFPMEPVLKVDIQVLRGWKMAQILYAPMAYNPAGKRVFQLSGNTMEISFETTSVGIDSASADLTVAEQIREMTVNFAETAGEYGGYAASADTGRYVIITTNSIVTASSNLDDFVASKEARGFTVQVVTEETWQNHAENNDTGDAAAEHIRAWLKAYYVSLNIKYVLLIGNPNPSTGDVPMKMCYPQKFNPAYPECPTDFYYAELVSDDWDSDDDAKYGEYTDDFSGNPPRTAQVAVGRIPYYGSTTDLDQILAKIVAYEALPEEDITWHRNVLLPMNPSDEDTPGYQLGEEIKDDILVPNGWSYHRVYDQYNNYCTPTPCVLSIPVDTETIPCTVTNVTNTWNGADYGAVFWWAHGSEISAEDVMNITSAATLDDAHPAFTFQCSCWNGRPETTTNLQYSLLKNGAIATVSATRVSWYEVGQTSFAGTPTNSGMTFEYADRLIGQGMYAGDALNGLKADVFPYHQVLWMNYLDFNLYGCPAVGLYTPPLIETDEATNVMTASARLNGSLISLGTSDGATVSFEWGTDSDGPYPYQTDNQTLTTTGVFSYDLAGLDPGATYYYRAKCAGWGTGYGDEKSFITPTEPPSVSTIAAADMGTTWAVLNGYLEDLGTADNVTVSFEWGLTTSYGNETTAQPSAGVGLFSENLTGLQAKTTYHFRAKAVGDGTERGVDMPITTLPIPPSVTTTDASNLTTTSARLNGNLTDMGTASSVTVSFQWGTTAGGPYPSSVGNQTKTSTGLFNANLSGLSPGTTYYYRARAVGDGTVDGLLEESFTTLTTPPTVITTDADNVAVDGARLNGNLQSKGTAVSVSVSFQWGTTSDNYTHETAAEVMTATGAFHFDLRGVASGTTFYYRAKAAGHGDPAYGEEKTFTTGSTPAVATLGASGLNFTEATLNGDLTSLGGADNVTVSFVWGATPDCSNETTAEVKTVIGAFHFELQGLDPGTTYYCKARANGDAGPVYGEQVVFSTLAQPAVSTSDASDVTTTSARLNGNLSSLGSAASVSVCFQWGTASGVYGNETTVEVKAGAGTFHFDLAGLTPGTNYYYRAKAVGDGGGIYGDQRSFTVSVAPPEVTTADASEVTADSALLNADLVSLGTKSTVTLSFLWKVSGGAYAETPVETKTATGAFVADLDGLAQGTTYYFKVKAVGAGSAVYGDEKSFTTADGAAPLISAVGASGISIAGATIKWTTDEPATSQVEYGLTEEYGSLTPLDTGLASSHSIELNGLKAGKVYHYRVVSTDAAGNRAISADGTFATPSRSGAMPIWLGILVAVGVITSVATLWVLLRGGWHKRQGDAAP